MMMDSFLRDRVWPRRGLTGWLGYAALRPLSELFRLAVGLRSLAYRWGLLHGQRAGIRVISVGNLAVGGTGKTPLALWLARRLRQRGMRVALLSRGYRGNSSKPTIVSEGGGAPLVGVERAGDEALMMARVFDGPIITAARRIDAAAEAMRLGCDVAVLDDGFQHRAMLRDFDIVIYDGRCGPLLPAGALRESCSALRRADAVVVVGDSTAPGQVPDATPVYNMKIELSELIESVGGEWLARPAGLLSGRRVIAVAGIAEPQRFYHLLQLWDAKIEEVFEFRDHHHYTTSDWQAIARRSQECDLIVTTEKDLVKLEAYPFATGKLMALRIEPVLDRADELIDRLLVAAKPPAGTWD
jgi:tetraacyldisaccharide 4'-kinase